MTQKTGSFSCSEKLPVFDFLLTFLRDSDTIKAQGLPTGIPNTVCERRFLMTIWKLLGLVGAGAAFILIFSSFGVAPYADQILTVIAGLCAAIFSMLAFIADKLSAKKS